MKKLLPIFSVVSFLLSIGLAGGGLFGYLWITNESNQEKIKKQLVDQITKSLPIPNLSGPALPTAAPPKGLSIPKF